MNGSQTDDSVQLSVNKVCKTYDQSELSGEATHALKDVSFEISKGSFIAIVGASGSGKSTLLRIMAGLLKPSSGSILLWGNPLNGVPKSVVCVFQEYNKSLLPWRNVEGNIEIALEPLGIPKQEISDRVDRYLKLVQLDQARKKYPWQLSGGMQQRVALARALSVEPEILLADEPFGSLDTLTRSHLEDEILRLWHNLKTTVVLVTHDIGEAVYLADRVLVLTGNPATVSADIPVCVQRPRNQLQTRSSEEFLRLRSHLFGLMSEGNLHEI